MMKKLLFKIAKGPLMGSVVGTVFQHCGWAIPVKKVYSSREIIAFHHPQPDWEIHFVIKPIFQMEENEEHPYAYFRSVLHSIDVLNAQFNIVRRGYSLVYQHNQPNDMACPIFHIVSGKKQRGMEVPRIDAAWQLCYHDLINPYKRSESYAARILRC